MANTKVTGDLIASGTITAANLVTGTLDGLLNTYLTTNTYATQSYVTTAVSNLIDSAPGSLDTLNELAAALNDDANFATTVTNALATKLNLSGGNITGNLSVDTNVLFVNSSTNRVGVGTVSPTEPLHLVGSNASFKIESTNANGSGSITFHDSAGLNGSIGYLSSSTDDLFIYNAANTSMILYTSATERMRITSAGNVGIGTSSPATTLHLNGLNSNDAKLRIGRSTSQTNYLELGTIGGSSHFIANGINSVNGEFIWSSDSNTGTPTERMRITSGGNLAVGNTSGTGGRVHITGAGVTSATTALFVQTSDSTLTFRVRNDGKISTGTAYNSPYNNTTGSAANLRVSASGDLERSTSSLKYKTEVRDYDKGLDFIEALRPVYYRGKNDGDKQFAGLIAEEVHDSGLEEFVQYAEDGSPDALAYTHMVALLVNGIKELKAEIETLKAQING